MSSRSWQLLARGWRPILVALVVLSVGLVSVATRRQLGLLGATTDEHFALGAKLRVNGTLGLSAAEPSALRPPGYPAFIAAVLAAWVDSPARLSLEEFERRGFRAVALAQAWVLAAAAVVLFFWLRLRVSEKMALLAAVAFGVNPYSVALIGLMHYSVLHWLMMLSGAYTLEHARIGGYSDRPMLVSGAVWGICSLVRPETLILPFVLLIVLLAGRQVGALRAMRAAAVMCVGMALTLAPWTARNYSVTGRFVPVVDYAWEGLWGQTVRPLGIHPNHYAWWELYERDMMPVFARVTGLTAFDYPTAVRSSGPLEAAFRNEAISNLRRQPQVFLLNAVATVTTFLLDINSVAVRAYQYLQTPAATSGQFPPAFLRLGHAQDFHSPSLSVSFRVWFSLLTVAAAVSLFCFGRRGGSPPVVALSVLLTLTSAYALVFMSFMHYYTKVPLMVALAFDLPESLTGNWRKTSEWLLSACVAASLVLTLAMLWPV